MSVTITTTSLPNGYVGTAYSQTVQQTGGAAPLDFSVASGALPTSLSIAALTGVISGTPTVAGLYTFSIEVEDDDAATDTQDFTIRVYEALVVSPEPDPGDDAVYIEAGAQLQFSAEGGSGNYQWSVNGGNLINPVTGLLTAINGGAYTVTLVDTESGQVTLTSIVITSQAQFCVTSENLDEESISGTPCCEFNVECGNRLQLRVPSFHVIENGVKQVVQYENVVQAVTGAASALQSRSADAGATGNTVSFTRDAYFEIVTSFDMAAIGNGAFGVGWSTQDIDSSIDTITHAVVWRTEAGERIVEVQHQGVVESGSEFPIAQGDVVSFGIINDELKLYINSVDVFTSSEDSTACGDMLLDVALEDASMTIGGYVTNLTWSISTSGDPSQVGVIDASGIYTSPSNPLVGVVSILGSLNNANFYVSVRNIKPTPKYTKPQPFLVGRRAHVWVTNRQATDSEIIRIASDGSPDAVQNPGMIYLGILEGSTVFAEEIEYQDFNNDEGTYATTIASEKANLSGTFLEVRDLDKLALLMTHATLQATSKGVNELSVGGKACGGCDLRAAIVVEAGACGSGWDVIYLPRVQNNGNLNFEIGKKTSTKYELKLRVLPDVTRPTGKQLYSIYQMANCGTESSDPCAGVQSELSVTTEESS